MQYHEVKACLNAGCFIKMLNRFWIKLCLQTIIQRKEEEKIQGGGIVLFSLMARPLPHPLLMARPLKEELFLWLPLVASLICFVKRSNNYIIFFLLFLVGGGILKIFITLRTHIFDYFYKRNCCKSWKAEWPNNHQAYRQKKYRWPY